MVKKALLHPKHCTHLTAKLILNKTSLSGQYKKVWMIHESLCGVWIKRYLLCVAKATSAAVQAVVFNCHATPLPLPESIPRGKHEVICTMAPVRTQPDAPLSPALQHKTKCLHTTESDAGFSTMFCSLQHSSDFTLTTSTPRPLLVSERKNWKSAHTSSFCPSVSFSQCLLTGFSLSRTKSDKGRQWERRMDDTIPEGMEANIICYSSAPI